VIGCIGIPGTSLSALSFSCFLLQKSSDHDRTYADGERLFAVMEGLLWCSNSRGIVQNAI